MLEIQETESSVLILFDRFEGQRLSQIPVSIMKSEEFSEKLMEKVLEMAKCQHLLAKLIELSPSDFVFTINPNTHKGSERIDEMLSTLKILPFSVEEENNLQLYKKFINYNKNNTFSSQKNKIRFLIGRFSEWLKPGFLAQSFNSEHKEELGNGRKEEIMVSEIPKKDFEEESFEGFLKQFDGEERNFEEEEVFNLKLQEEEEFERGEFNVIEDVIFGEKLDTEIFGWEDIYTI